MAITTVNSRYEGFIFDGENSRNYGVYVTDVKVFGTPVRNVEMIQIPGRNGSYALDNGNFENIEVAYTCALGADSQADFNDAISDLRNMLASRIGYKRLEDEINTTEYRMAVYKGGLDVPTLNKETGTFEVVFDCKPQRFLKSGETAVSVSDGGAIVNPTLFDASPLIQFKGYASTDGITIGHSTPIMVNNEPYGLLTLSNSSLRMGAQPLKSANLALMNTNDDITMNAGGSFTGQIAKSGLGKITGASATISGDIGGSVNASYTSSMATIPVTLSSVGFKKGVTETKNISVGVVINYEVSGTAYTYTGTMSYTLTYDASAETLEYAYTGISPALPAALVLRSYTAGKGWGFADVFGDSTKTPASDTVYIDLDLGEAYTYINGAPASVNNIVEMPADLPVLEPASNTIHYDNTVTQFKITPRWWKV